MRYLKRKILVTIEKEMRAIVLVDLLLITTIGANLATIITLIVSVYSLKKEVIRYSNSLQNIQQSIIEYINKVSISAEQKQEFNNSVLLNPTISNVAGVSK
jgi:hypothetical protein